MGGVCENNVNNSLRNVNKSSRVMRQRIFQKFLALFFAAPCAKFFRSVRREDFFRMRDDLVDLREPSRSLVTARKHPLRRPHE